MAADGRVVSLSDRITNDHMDKLVALPDGRVMGVAGCPTDIPILRRWVDAGADFSKPPKLDKNTEALILARGGAVWWLDSAFALIEQQAPVAIGSGAALAEGAMLAGEGPAQAVRIAAQRCASVGGRIRTMLPR